MQVTVCQLVPHLGKTALDDIETRILRSQLPAGRDRLWILVETQQPAMLAQLLQYLSAMATAAKGTVHVAAVALAVGARLRPAER